MKSYIIGIAGELNSGKDTLASMINYIFAKGVTQVNYSEWLTQKVKYDASYKHRITHFADPMKDCLSIMYNIPREYFDDRKYKDELWYCTKEKRFLIENDVIISGKYALLTINELNRVDGLHLADFIHMYNKYINNKILAIKLRTLMQYFGTEIGRKLLGDNIWVDATMGKAADIAERNGICIIPDVRYKNEWQAITGNLLYGQDIEIRRDNSDQTDHSSETIDFQCKHIIDNNGSKMQLFYKAVKVVDSIVNK